MNKTDFLKTFKSEKFIPFAIFIFAFLARIWFLALIRRDPAFIMPIVDSLEFDIWACDILNGNLLWTQLQSHTPLYAYFVAGIYKIFGYGVLNVILLQYLIASAGCVLIYFITKQLVNKTAAIISSIFMATYWFFIYVQSFIFSENLSLLLNIVLIYILDFMKDDIKKYIFSGIILGLSVICRPDILLFALFILIWLTLRRLTVKKVVYFYSLFILSFLIIIGPVLWRNYLISGEFPLLRTQVGASFYQGNNPDFKGTSINLEIGKDWEDFIATPYRQLKHELKESEFNNFFMKETFKIIKKQPISWLKLIAGKVFSILTGRDFLRSEDVYFYDNYMAEMPFRAVSTRLIFILAVVGIVLSLQRPKQFLLLYTFLISEAFIIFFSIKTRYLMPILPFIIIFYSYAIYSLFESFKNKKTALSLFIILSVCLLNLVSFFNPLKVTYPSLAETYFAIAKNYHSRGNINEAVDFYSRTIHLNPRHISAYNDLGVLFLNLEDYEKALSCFEKALSIDKNTIKPQLNYKLCQELMSEKKKDK
ncbi:MAG: glycosyltransferase family 39 protein [Candidatus Omnitrophota bacterium]|nr:glycosyltransferase family 39 protein [Candidatus Omnitrophota bacterium]